MSGGRLLRGKAGQTMLDSETHLLVLFRAGSHFDISISTSINISIRKFIRKVCVNRGYISVSISTRNGTFSIFLCLCLCLSLYAYVKV